MSKTFDAYTVADIVYEVTSRFLGDEWNPKKDFGFLIYLQKLGVLSDWVEVHGPLTKQIKLKLEKSDKK